MTNQIEKVWAIEDSSTGDFLGINYGATPYGAYLDYLEDEGIEYCPKTIKVPANLKVTEVVQTTLGEVNGNQGCHVMIYDNHIHHQAFWADDNDWEECGEMAVFLPRKFYPDYPHLQEIVDLDYYNEIDWADFAANYWLAEAGEQVVINCDFSITFFSSTMIVARDYLAVFKAPGLGNLDSSFFTEDYARKGDDGFYYEIETGKVIGDLSDVVMNCAYEGHYPEHIDEWVEEVKRQVEEYNRSW